MKIKSIEEAVHSGPFNRYSKYRDVLIDLVDPEHTSQVELSAGRWFEHSLHADVDMIQKIIDTGNTVESIQEVYELVRNPARRFLVYSAFNIPTPDAQAVAELKQLVEPFLMHKGTLIEPVKFEGKKPIVYRVVAYDDLIPILVDKYQCKKLPY